MYYSSCGSGKRSGDLKDFLVVRLPKDLVSTLECGSREPVDFTGLEG